MINKVVRAYIAGLIDGEGCIAIVKRKSGKGKPWYYQPIVTIGNTDKRMLEFVNHYYKGWIVKNSHKDKKRKQSYLWSIAGSRMRVFLDEVLPYLVIKRKQAKLALSFPNYQHRGFGWGKTAIGRSQEEIKKQDDLWIEMKKLNGTYSYDKSCQ